MQPSKKFAHNRKTIILMESFHDNEGPIYKATIVAKKNEAMKKSAESQ